MVLLLCCPNNAVTNSFKIAVALVANTMGCRQVHGLTEVLLILLAWPGFVPGLSGSGALRVHTKGGTIWAVFLYTASQEHKKTLNKQTSQARMFKTFAPVCSHPIMGERVAGQSPSQ